jgi:cysteinyl-tRNA synthetase
MDFVIWKSAKSTEPADAKWDSATSGHTYGVGRPGWHIECSAMCGQTLGESFDIHGGGMDLQFPHHENEIAQTEGVTGKTMAQVWMHNGLVQLDNEKMSKSLGNFFTIREVLAKYDPQTVRFFLVRGHYRTALGYSDAHLDDARNSLKRLYTALDLVPPATDALVIDWTQSYAKRFACAMDDDFGTPEAVAVLFEMATEVNRTQSAELSALLKALGACLGLLQGSPKDFLQAGAKLDETAIAALIAQRQDAKASRDFARADQIRKDLLVQGVVLKDSATGTTWEVVQ